MLALRTAILVSLLLGATAEGAPASAMSDSGRLAQTVWSLQAVEGILRRSRIPRWPCRRGRARFALTLLSENVSA